MKRPVTGDVISVDGLCSTEKKRFSRRGHRLNRNPVVCDPLRNQIDARHTRRICRDVRPHGDAMTRVLKRLSIPHGDPTSGALADWKHRGLHNVFGPFATPS